MGGGSRRFRLSAQLEVTPPQDLPPYVGQRRPDVLARFVDRAARHRRRERTSTALLAGAVLGIIAIGAFGPGGLATLWIAGFCVAGALVGAAIRLVGLRLKCPA